MFFFAVIAIWGVQTNISGAVLATGKVQVSSVRTAIQHPTGGIVADLLVENGDRVEQGDIVVRLDDAQLKADLKIVESELFESLANSARLKAMIDDSPDLIMDPLLEKQSTLDAGVDTLLRRQRQQLAAHYESLDASRKSLTLQIREIENQVAGARAELEATIEKLAFIDSELVRLGEAREQGLVPMTEVQNARKEYIDTEGEIGRLQAGIAALNGSRLDLELKSRDFLPTLKERAGESLNVLERGSSKLLATRNAILHELGNLEIRAPMAGVIHDSRVEGLRSVITAGKPLMYVVPEDSPSTILARVEANDIDEVSLGQEAMLKFTAFDSRTLPIIYGKVSKISADAFLDPKTQAAYYNVEIIPIEGEIEKLGDRQLISGMPLSVFITTSSRSPLDYVIQPVSRFMDRALRD